MVEARLTLEDLEQVPFTTIYTLAELIRTIEIIDSRIVFTRLYKTRIFVVLKAQNLDFLLLVQEPDGNLSERQWSIDKGQCPLSIITKLEEANTKNQLLEGHPCVGLVIPKEVDNYIIGVVRKKKRRKTFSYFFCLCFQTFWLDKMKRKA